MSDTKSLLKHSRNYLFAHIATKALAFVSIPVYTRIMTVADYGVVNVFMSVIGIAVVLLKLNCQSSINRYYYDAKDEEDYKRFVGTNIVLVFIIFAVLSLIGIVLLPFISRLLAFNYLLTLSIIPVAAYTIVNTVFTSIYSPLMESKKIAVVTAIQVYLSFAISIVCIIAMDSNKYFGYVLGNIIASVLLAVYMVRQIKPYCTLCFDKKYLGYIFNYALPTIPYKLSAVIIAQFSKIFMSSQQGFESAGVYSLANNIASLLSIVILTTNDAWIPYFFRYMNAKDHKSIDHDLNLIWRLTLIAGFFLSLFAWEMGYILAGRDYLEQLYIAPVVVFGFLFFQWAYVFLRNTLYAKKNIWNALAIIIGGISNVLLNSWLIPLYSGLGAAIAIMISYLLMLISGALFNHFILKEYCPRTGLFMKPLLIYLPFCIVSILSYRIPWTLSVLGIKIILFLLLCVVLLLPYRTQLITIINNRLKK